MPGPLEGLRVLEVATGVAGPYAGRLFAMLGATVVKVEPAGGDPARTASIDDRPTAGDSPLFVHLNAGKHNVDAAAEELLGWADVVIDDRVRTAVDRTAFAPDALRALPDGPGVLATVTAWGFEAARPGRMEDELVVQAASAALSETGDPGREAVRFPGWQSQYLAGGYAAAAALSSLGQDTFRHVDVSWVGAMMSGVESGLGTELHRPVAREERDSGRSRDITSGAFPAGAFRCADGYFVPGTVRPADWPLQCEVYGRPDLVDDERFTAVLRMQNREQLVAEIQPWYDAHTKREIFAAAIETGWAAAMVMTAGDVLADEHVAERRFLATVGGTDIALPGRPWRAPDLPEAVPVALAGRGTSRVPARRAVREFVMPATRALKVVELTWAWAGPFIGRFLGALGADVIRIETGRYPDGWRSRVRWRDVGGAVAEGTHPDDITWDAAPLHNTINRNKRSLSLDLSTDDGRAVLARLLGVADAMVVNMGHSVLVDRGVDGMIRDAIEHGLVLLQMPALGATGPYKSMPGYGTLIEGMGGLAARMGYSDEGARVTSTYYPDAVAGLHGTVALLAALGARRTHGRGAFVDLSQQEAMWMQLGEGLVLRSTEGREPDRLGNAEPGVAPSGIYRCRDGGDVAVIVGSDDEFGALAKLASPALDSFLTADGPERVARRSELDKAMGVWLATLDTVDAVARLRQAGAAAEPVITYRAARRDGALKDRGLIEEVEHPVTGARRYLRVPVRIEGEILTSARHAPVFAQHTDEVLVDWLGMPDDERARLREAEVIGTRPVRQSRR